MNQSPLWGILSNSQPLVLRGIHGNPGASTISQKPLKVTWTLQESRCLVFARELVVLVKGEIHVIGGLGGRVDTGHRRLEE